MPTTTPPPEPDQVPGVIDGCLERLGVETVDLLYVHWPTGIYSHDELLPTFEAAVEAGAARRLGLSNFTPALLDEARDSLDVPVFAHQVEMQSE